MNSQVWTKALVNDTFILTEAMGFLTVSFVLTSGAATFIGNLNIPSASEAVGMIVGLPITIVSKSNSPLTGITIAAPAGMVDIVGQQ